MGEYAEYQLAWDMRHMPRNFSTPPVPYWDKVACPVCGKLCGGRGDHMLDGVHMHMKFKHGLRRKKDRDALLEAAKTTQEETT